MNQTFYKGKKVFLTGHTGFKGSWLSIWLCKSGADVTGYALEPPTIPSMFDICGIDRHICSRIGDVRDRNNLYRAVKESGAEIIIHLAAQPLVRQSHENPVETYETNVMGTVNLLNAVRECPKVRAVVIVTSDKCYENTESVSGYKEGDRLGGYDPYSSSKACAEIVTSAFINSYFHPSDYNVHKVAIATARAGNVIGGGDFARDRLIPDCIKALTSGNKVVVRNPGSVRPWQHVLEPLSGYLNLAEKLYSSGSEFIGAWNFGPRDSDGKTVEYIVGKFCSLWANDSGYILDKNTQPHETGCLRLNSTKSRDLLGYRPVWDIDKALDMTNNWTKHYLNRNSMFEVCLNQIDEYEKHSEKSCSIE